MIVCLLRRIVPKKSIVFGFTFYAGSSVGVVGCSFFFQAEDGIRDVLGSRGLGDVYKRQDY